MEGRERGVKLVYLQKWGHTENYVWEKVSRPVWLEQKTDNKGAMEERVRIID